MKCKKITAIGLLLLLLTGCGRGGENQPALPEGNQSQQEQVIDYGATLNLYAYAPDTLNPLITGYRCNVEMLGLIYEGLFCTEQDFTASPVLASGYDSNADNSQYTVYLKSGVRFHDGSGFDANDVIFTMDRMRQYQSPFAVCLDNVQRYYASGNAVVFELKQPQANFVNLLDFPILPDNVPSGGFAKESGAFVPVGTGKYKYDHETEYKRLMLRWNADWHGGNAAQTKHYIEQIRVSYIKDKDTGVYSFDAGELDLLTTSVFTWGNHSITRTVQTIEHTNNLYAFVGVNHRNTALGDAAVRRALNRAIDKARLVNDVMFDHAAAADAPVNPEAYYFDAQTQTPVFDTEAAKAILAEAGWLDLNGDGILEKVFDGRQQALSFELLYNNDNAQRQTIAAYMQSAFAAIGVQLKLLPVPFETYQSRIGAAQYDLYLGQMDLRSDGALDFLLRTDGGQNTFGYAGADGELDVVSRAKSREQIIAAYGRLQSKLAEHMPVIGLFYGKSAVLQGTRVQGDIHPSRTGPFTGMEALYFVDKKQ